MDGRTRDHHHQAREIAEDDPLPLRQIRAQKRPKHILIQRNRTIHQFLPVNSAVTGEAVKAKIKEIQTRRVFDIIGVYEDNAIREVGKLSKAQNGLNISPWLSITTMLPFPAINWSISRIIKLCSSCVLPCPEPPTT